MTALYVATLFVSAWLLFSVQPMIAKQLLPDLGGAPIVWNTCLVFFQAMLLGGYCYAHIVTVRLRLRRQLLLHLTLLSAPLLLFAVLATAGEGPLGAPPALRTWLRNSVHPIVGLAVVLTTTIGLPFFVLSSSAPLMQRWYWRTSSIPTGDPYFLYAASNLGSLTALLGYPLLERRLELSRQSWLWCSGYVSLFVLASFCALALWKVSAREPCAGIPEIQARASRPRLGHSGAASINATRQLRWLALAAAPSSLLVSVTNFITADVAAVPLAWVIPLAIYLLTFILAFARRQLLPHWLVMRYFPMVLIVWSITLVIGATEPASVLFATHLTTFFVASLACHGALRGDRPPPERLTNFYLCLSLGGVLGGVSTALLAPKIFDDFFEYPIIMIGSYAISNLRSISNRELEARADASGPASLRLGGDIAVAVAAGVFVILAAFALDAAGFSAARTLEDTEARYLRGALFALPLIVIGIWSARTIRFSLGLAAILLGAHLSSNTGQVIHAERTWYGLHRVTWDSDGRFHQLVHGSTVHGRQRWPPAQAAPPGAYYHPTGPLGDVFESQQERGTFRRVAIAGLGAGCIAYYGRDVPEQRWTFFEIDPAVVRIASDPRFFTFLRDAFPDPSRLDVVIGDARLKFAEEPDSAYDLIILDAFSSDSIPAHLLTQEALGIYASKLADRGLLVFHVSNRHLDFRGLLASLAEGHDEPLVCFGCDEFTGAQTLQESQDGKMASQWVAIARQVSHLGPLAREGGRWRILAADSDDTAWTDNYADILAVWKRE
jgi:hypothetical protein